MQSNWAFIRSGRPLALAFVVGAATASAQVHLPVSHVGIAAKPIVFTGPCPTTIQFTATIFVPRFPIAVEYQWERSDGTVGEKRQVEIAALSQTLSDSWTVGAKGDRTRIWEKLHVVAPASVSSAEGHAAITCQ